jgi:guanylate kinase
MSSGHLFVISGSSGVGKGTIMKQVMERMPEMQFSVSATSRLPRPGETNGVQYFFVTEDAFKQMIEQGAFVEYDYHMGNYYGTLKSEILNKTKTGAMLLDIEPVGALRVREIFPEATLIYVAPPSLEELENRLRGRNDTSEEQMKLRRERAAWESTQMEKYDYVVVNDILENCVQNVLHIIQKKMEE